MNDEIDHDECQCERSSQSEFSPGLVDDGENLSRSVWTPNHILADGTITPGAFPREELMGKKGKSVSVDRMEYADGDKIRAYGEDRAVKNKDASWAFAGICIASAGAIRSLQSPAATQAFCVVDAAEEDNVAHAGFSRSGDQDRAEIGRLRGALVDLFGKASKP